MPCEIVVSTDFTHFHRLLIEDVFAAHYTSGNYVRVMNSLLVDFLLTQE